MRTNLDQIKDALKIGLVKNSYNRRARMETIIEWIKQKSQVYVEL